MRLKLVRQSFSEFKSVKNLCIMAILMALYMVVRFIGTFEIKDFIRIEFGFLIFLIAGSMFGPAFAFLIGFLGDVVCYFMFSSGKAPYNFGFTISSMVSALIYALFLYKYKLTIMRAILAQIIHDVIISLILNTYFLAPMYFNGDISKCFFLRLPKFLICLPINCALAVSLLILFRNVAKQIKLN